MSSGTLGDKIAALTLLVQESPIQNLTSLESLINMTKKKGKRECMMAAGMLIAFINKMISPSVLFTQVVNNCFLLLLCLCQSLILAYT